MPEWEGDDYSDLDDLLAEAFFKAAWGSRELRLARRAEDALMELRELRRREDAER